MAYYRRWSSSSSRSRSGTCGRCGKTTYPDVHPEFPECSHGCAEWLVDRHIEEKHGIYSDDERGGW
jgi:endogenous inhibitor of DNA gyrase (YacG/DUF329 family)